LPGDTSVDLLALDDKGAIRSLPRVTNADRFKWAPFASACDAPPWCRFLLDGSTCLAISVGSLFQSQQVLSAPSPPECGGSLFPRLAGPGGGRGGISFAFFQASAARLERLATCRTYPVIQSPRRSWVFARSGLVRLGSPRCWSFRCNCAGLRLGSWRASGEENPVSSPDSVSCAHDRIVDLDCLRVHDPQLSGRNS